MRELALHLLDLAENSVAAEARMIAIRVDEDLAQDRLRLSIADDGRGMEASQAARAADPFVTGCSERRVGLGLPLLKAAAEACQGSLELRSRPGTGTCVTVEFQRSHIDRMPLGDLAGAWLTLLATHAQVHWHFEYRAGQTVFVFDDEALKLELGSLPLTDSTVLRFLRPLLAEGVARVRRAAPEPLLAVPAGGH